MHTHFPFVSCFSPVSICLPSSLHLLSPAQSFFFPSKFHSPILPPWLNHRWFKIHTYVARHRTQTSVQTIFKPRFITSAPPGGWGKGKSRPYIGLQQLLKWNKKETLSSYNMLSWHQCWKKNVQRPAFLSLPVQSWIASKSPNMFNLTNKRWYWLNEIYRVCWCSANCKMFPLQAAQRADTLFWWVEVLGFISCCEAPRRTCKQHFMHIKQLMMHT